MIFRNRRSFEHEPLSDHDYERMMRYRMEGYDHEHEHDHEGQARIFYQTPKQFREHHHDELQPYGHPDKDRDGDGVVADDLLKVNIFDSRERRRSW